MNISQFARELNLSKGTVSRALNDRAEVSASTRQRVLEKARAFGFVPNPAARRLVMDKSYLIGLDCPGDACILADHYLVQLVCSVEEAAGAEGYDLLLRLGASRRNASRAEFKSADRLIFIISHDTRAEDILLLTDGGRLPTVVIAGHDPDSRGRLFFTSVWTHVQACARRLSCSLPAGIGASGTSAVLSARTGCAQRYPRFCEGCGLVTTPVCP